VLEALAALNDGVGARRVAGRLDMELHGSLLW